MKAYITCPVSLSQKRFDLLPEIKKIVEDKGIDCFVFQIGGRPDEIFKRDYEQLKSCNLLIAEVSEASHGVGMEIGMAVCLGLKIILIYEKGSYVSPLTKGIPGVKMVEYSGLEEFKTGLSLSL